MGDSRPLPEHVRKAIALGRALPRESPVGRARQDAIEGPRSNLRNSSGRTKLEAEWAEELELRRRAGELVLVLEQPMSLRLAKRTHYRPDFIVHYADGRLEIHEVKGHWEDDARAKWKIAADRHRWATFLAITRPGRGRDRAWSIETAKVSC